MPLRPLQRDLFGRSGPHPLVLTQPRALAPAARLARGLRRRWPAAALVLALSLAAAALALVCARPVYRASEELEAQDLRPPVRFDSLPPSDVNASPAGVQSLAGEFGARALVADAVRSLPPPQRRALPLRRLRRPRWLASLLAAWLPPPRPPTAAMRQLQVAALTGSRLIQVRFDANRPELAEAFLRSLNAAARRSAAARARRRSGQRLAALARQTQAALAQAQTAEAALQQLAARGAPPDPVARLALAGQSARLFAAARTGAAIRATRRAAALAAGALPVTPATPDGAPPLPAGLELQRAQQAAEVARLAALYRPQAAPLVEARRRLASLDQSLLALRRRRTAALRRSLASARAQENSLRQALHRQAAAQAALRPAAAAFTLAQRRLQVRQDAYAALLQQLAHATAESGALAPPWRVVDAARSPRRPLWPRPAPALAEALLLGALLGLATLWALERWDDALRLPEAAELGVPLLAVLPARLDASPAYASALEPAVASLLRARRDSGARVVLLTGAAPHAGTTALARALAARLAQLAPDALLILAHPAPTSASPPLGLTDVLAGRCGVDAAMHDAPGPGGFACLPAGSGDGLLASLASGEAEKLLAAAAARFAWVVVDAPPESAGPDAALWAELADVTLLVAAAGRTPRRNVRRSLDALERAGAARLALVLSQAPPALAAAAPVSLLPPDPRTGNPVALRQRA